MTWGSQSDISLRMPAASPWLTLRWNDVRQCTRMYDPCGGQSVSVTRTHSTFSPDTTHW